MHGKQQLELVESKLAEERAIESGPIYLSANAHHVLRQRYLLRDELGHIIESPAQMFRRVARTVATAELAYDRGADIAGLEDEFYDLMANLDFLPNSPTLMNAGTRIGQLSACFVLPVEDSLKSIFETLKHMAVVQQSGAGVGISFSKLRPKGCRLKSTMGQTSGPVSFMEVFSYAADAIKRGGKRRGANMGILKVDHPDIVEFVTAKSNDDCLQNFNLSVAVTDEFMSKVRDNEDYELINPHTDSAVQTVSAASIFHLISEMAWKVGDPGLIFIDEINGHNPTPMLGRIESTNPCGEQPLLPFESCNIGSLNLSHVCKEESVDWRKLERLVKLAVHFLDNVIDVSRFPLKRIRDRTRSNRKIGLGVMGFADLLAQMRIPYDSSAATTLAEKIMEFIFEGAVQTSVELSESRGSFANFPGSLWDRRGFRGIRNATVTTIAPTGTLSLIAGCSSGIEPIFAISFLRRMADGPPVREVNPIFEEKAREAGFYTEELMNRISETGSIQRIEEVPEDVRRVFVTALDISPDWHVRVQAAFQKHCDNAVSKTVNLPEQATVDDVKRIFLLAHSLKCKGITVFRYGSKKQQVLSIGSFAADKGGTGRFTVPADYAGNCMTEYCTA